MYGHKARNSLIAILKEAPELKVGKPPKSVVTPKGFRDIVDRILVELWMRGFAVEARRAGKSKPPQDGLDHKAWRDAKIAPKLAQADVEGTSGTGRRVGGRPRGSGRSRRKSPEAAAPSP